MNFMKRRQSIKEISLKKEQKSMVDAPNSAPDRTRRIGPEDIENEEQKMDSDSMLLENVQQPQNRVDENKIKLQIFAIESDDGQFQEDELPNLSENIVSKKLSQKDYQLLECQFCAQLLQKKDMNQSFDCKHSYCKSCLHQYFRTKIKEFKLVSCPSQGCKGLLKQNSQILNDLGQDFQIKYQQIKFRAMVEARGQNFKICPNQNCERGIIEVKENKKKGICEKCAFVYCVECMMREHNGQCEGIGANLLKNKYKYKRCVNCKMIVQRNQGCPHMTCKCGAQFCYNCGSKWGSGHHCLRNRINGPLVTERLYQKLKCLIPSDYQFEESLLGFASKIPFYLVFFVLISLWISWCVIYGIIFFSLVLVAGLLSGQFVLVAKMFQSPHRYSKLLFVIFIILFPLMIPFTGIAVGIILFSEIGGRHFIHPAFGGKLFPIFALCCK